MQIALGGLVVRLDGATPEFDDERTQLGAFVVPDPADVVVRLSGDYVPASQPGGFRLLESRYEEADRSVHLWTTDWSASFFLGQARVDASLRLQRPLVLDSLLRTTAQIFAPVLGTSVYLHASSVVREGEGFVFAGASEAGKTTVALLSRDRGLEVVDEELTCVSLLGGTPVLRGTPFFEKSGFAGRPLEAPLRRLYLLRQARRDEVRGLDPRRALSQVTSCVAIGARQPPLLAAGLDAAIELTRRVPVRLLYFRKAPSFWDAIADDLRSA